MGNDICHEKKDIHPFFQALEKIKVKKEMTFVIQEVMEVKKTADKLQFRKC